MIRGVRAMNSSHEHACWPIWTELVESAGCRAQRQSESAVVGVKNVAMESLPVLRPSSALRSRNAGNCISIGLVHEAGGMHTRDQFQ
jgi:hypothetical protein